MKISKDLKKQMQRALTKTTDMTPELETEVVDVIVGVIDKNVGPDGILIEPASKAVKDTLDKQ